MAKRYRVEVTLKGKALCAIDIDVPWVDESLSHVLSLFSDDQDYDIQIFISEDVKQIYESSNSGVKLLASKPIYYLDVQSNKS